MMSKLEYRGEYTCPSCGLGVTVSNPFEDVVPQIPPVLICPSCGRMTFRTNTLERFYLQTFHEYKCAAVEIMEKRMKEAEEKSSKVLEVQE